MSSSDQGPSDNWAHDSGGGVTIAGTSAGGGPRVDQDLSNPITHSGRSQYSYQPSGQSATIPTGIERLNPSTQNVRGQQDFVGVTSGTEVPVVEEITIQSDEEEEPIDMSSPVSRGGGGVSAYSNFGQSVKRLEVEDALNYLDKVKVNFQGEAQLYHHFLDIMKDYKAETIDTPAVVTRVSQLFRGHPELILGFNAFLPQGHKVETLANGALRVSVIQQGGEKVVTTIQPGLPGSPIRHSTTRNTIIRPPLPLIPGSSRTPGPSRSPAPPRTPVPPRTPSSAKARGPPRTPTRASLSNRSNGSGRMSPQEETFPGNANTSESSGSAAFTDSFNSSPVVQSAFPSLQSNPAEFNQAVNYVNKIKHQFQGDQADTYKNFLDILQGYQKEQRNIKAGHPPSSDYLSPDEVYSQVAKLFENHEDLVEEFGQFFPDATTQENTAAIDEAKRSVVMSRDSVAGPSKRSKAKKRPSNQSQKPKANSAFQDGKDVRLVEAGSSGTRNDSVFLDKVRGLLKSPTLYKNFCRCLRLHNTKLVPGAELLDLVKPFLAKSPELQTWIKDYVLKYESVSINLDLAHSPARKPNEKLREESVEIDYTACQRLGPTYRAMPKNNLPARCSGRNLLPAHCREALNDVWVSCPSSSSQYTVFSSPRTTTFQEHMYRVEDERFELDVIIEHNSAVIRAFEAIAARMERMSPEELEEFTLDERLGGNSPTIHQRAIRRLYGDSAPKIIEGLRTHPRVAIPTVLHRLKNKGEDWRDAQKEFNKTWADEMEEFYVKSLDVKGVSFKKTDERTLRPITLIREITALSQERGSPQLTFLYPDRSILDDACLLLLHHVRRQGGIGRDEQRKMKQLLKQFLAELFHQTRFELSDDEEEYGRRGPNNDTGEGKKKKRGRRRGNGNSTPNGGGEKGSPGIIEPWDDAPASSTPSTWKDLTKKKKLSTAEESPAPEPKRHTVGKREWKSLLRDAHELSERERTSLRDKVNRDYLGEKEKKDDALGGTTSLGQQPSASKRRATRQSLSEEASTSHEVDAEPPTDTAETPVPEPPITPTPTPPDEDEAFTLFYPDEDEASTLFYTNKNWYIFLRLHQVLCERLSKISECAARLLMENPSGNQSNPTAQGLRLVPEEDIDYSTYYPQFLEMIRDLLDGYMEQRAYEDTLQKMFTIHAYIAYTMDKVVSSAVKQLQGIVSDDTSWKFVEIFHKATGKNGGHGGVCQNSSQPRRVHSKTWYRTRVEEVCGEDPAIKIMIFKEECRVTMGLMESDTPEEEDFEEKAKDSNDHDPPAGEDDFEEEAKDSNDTPSAEDFDENVNYSNDTPWTEECGMDSVFEENGMDSNDVTPFFKLDNNVPETILDSPGPSPTFLARNIRKGTKKSSPDLEFHNGMDWESYNAMHGNGSGHLEEMEADLPEEAIGPMNIPGGGDDVNSNPEPGLDEVDLDRVIFVREKPVNVTPADTGDYALWSKACEEEDTERDHVERESFGWEPQHEGLAELSGSVEENPQRMQRSLGSSRKRKVKKNTDAEWFYLRGAMQRARKPQQNKPALKSSNIFRLWHQNWLLENVPGEAPATSDEFLLDYGGRYSEIVLQE